MAVIYGELDLTNQPSGKKFTVPLFDLTGFNVQSAHPQFYKSPAHLLFRNVSVADLIITDDTYGALTYLPQNSTSAVPMLPHYSYLYILVDHSIAENGGGTGIAGQSTGLYIIYYHPGEPLPSPHGR